MEGKTGKVDPGFLQGKGDVGVGEWEQKCWALEGKNEKTALVFSVSQDTAGSLCWGVAFDVLYIF